MKSTIHKKNNLQYRLPRLLVTEIQFFFNNTGRMLFLLFNIAIPVVVEMILPTFIHKHIWFKSPLDLFASSHFNYDNGYVGHWAWLPFFLRAVVLYILIKSFAILFGKNKIDKTRALFLYYNKYQVIMAKMTTATCDFLLAFLCLLFCGNIIAWSQDENFDFASYNKWAFLMLLGLLILYLFAFSMIKWITALVPSQKVAYVLSFTLIICLTAQIYFLNANLATSVVPVNTILSRRVQIGSGGLSASPARWLIAHQAIVTWIPFLNIGLMGGIGQIGFLNNSFGICIEISKHENRCWDLPIFLHRHLLEHDWYGVIPIIYLIFFWAVTWQWQVLAQKRYFSLG